MMGYGWRFPRIRIQLDFALHHGAIPDEPSTIIRCDLPFHHGDRLSGADAKHVLAAMREGLAAKQGAGNAGGG